MNKLGGLREPIQDGEAATKKYVDDQPKKCLDDRGNIFLERNIDVKGRRIFSLSEPTLEDEAATKKYVDNTIYKKIEEKKVLPQDPATKKYVDDAIKNIAGGDALVSKEGVFLKENGHYRATATIDMDTNKIENLPIPEDEGDAVNKKYINDIAKTLTTEKALIKRNGGYNVLGGYLNMNFNKIKNLRFPEDKHDAVTMDWVENYNERIENKRTHLTAASSSYHGNLIKVDYQFTFGGSSLKTKTNTMSFKCHEVGK